ncbi:hypothetical protein V1227_15695 [Lentzea sp. DG1S-22]|nr:hypothetical protein [Lentzea sp. DG1S-22]WVH84123.1 hypothetical protein V1227_15695 [Lentzea sp. DG1S-22]
MSNPPSVSSLAVARFTASDAESPRIVMRKVRRWSFSSCSRSLSSMVMQ